MKIKILLLFSVLLLVACNGDEKELKNEVTKEVRGKETNSVVVDKTISNENSMRVDELSRQLSGYLSKVPMPNTGTIEMLTPIKDQYASLSEDGSLHIQMNFQQYDANWDPFPMLLTVTASNTNEYLIWDESYVKEGDLYISEIYNDIVFQEKDLWISYSSRPMEKSIGAMPLDHIKGYVKRSRPDYQFAKILQIPPDNYKNPMYLLNDKLPITILSTISLNDEIDYTYQKNMKHHFIVENEDMRIVQSKGELYDYGISGIEEFKQFATPMTMNGISGYLDEMDTLGYHFSYDGLQFFIRPGQDVNQETGRVTMKYHDNWEDTIEKTVIGLVGKIQKNDKNRGDVKGGKSLVKEDDDGFIYLAGISLKTSDNEVYELLGPPTREELDSEQPILRYLIYEDEQLTIAVSEGFVDKVMLTSPNATIAEDILKNTQSEIYQDGDYYYLMNEDSRSVLSYNESEMALYFIDMHAAMLAESKTATKIR